MGQMASHMSAVKYVGSEGKKKRHFYCVIYFLSKPRNNDILLDVCTGESKNESVNSPVTVISRKNLILCSHENSCSSLEINLPLSLSECIRHTNEIVVKWPCSIDVCLYDGEQMNAIDFVDKSTKQSHVSNHWTWCSPFYWCLLKERNKQDFSLGGELVFSAKKKIFSTHRKKTTTYSYRFCFLPSVGVRFFFVFRWMSLWPDIKEDARVAHCL